MKPGLSLLAVLIALYSLAGVQLYSFANDPGVGWHLQTGKEILNSTHIPYFDTFLAGVEKRPWISDQWLADLVIYAVYKYTGWVGIYSFFITLFFSIYFIILPSLKSKHLSNLSFLLGVVFAFKLAQIHFIVRPVVFGFLFFSILLIWLERIGEQKKISAKFYFFSPLLFLLWANIHPSFPLGLVIYGIYIVGWYLDSKINADQKPYQSLLFLSVFSFLATFFNPYGYELHKSIFFLGSNAYFMNLHMEWRSPDFKSPEGKILILFLSLIILGRQLGDNLRKLSYSRVLSIILFSYFAFSSIRILPYLGIVLILPFAESIGGIGKIFSLDILNRVRRFPLLLQRVDDYEKNSFGLRRSGIVVIVVFLLSVLFLKSIPIYNGQYGPSSNKFPYDAVEIIRSEGNKEVTVLAPPEWGGFITWQTDSKVRPFLDDRNTLLGEKPYMDFYDEFPKPDEWQKYIEKLGPNYILLPTTYPIAYSISTVTEKYKLLFKDNKSILFRVK